MFVRARVLGLVCVCLCVITSTEGVLKSVNRSNIDIRGPRQHTPIDPKDVRTVHLVQSNHLDIGFSDFATNVLNRYLTGGWGTASPPEPRNKSVYYDSFLLTAANTSQILREKNSSVGAPRYVYTENAWVIKLFLDCEDEKGLFPHVNVPEADVIRCPTREQRATLVSALERGDTVMHAFPHSSEPEFADVATFYAGIDLAQHLATSLKTQPPRVLSQRDVPGLTRGAVPLLANKGVIGVSVGANDGSPAPMVPSTVDCYHGYQQVRTPFVWRDEASNKSVVIDIHPGGYGGELPNLNPNTVDNASTYSRDGLLCDCVGVPGVPDIMCYAFRGDNYGPAGVNETELNFKVFRAAFPNATVKASPFDTFFAIVNEPETRSRLPVVTSEIADTWVYGSASDPLKVAQMRAMMRARSECLEQADCLAETKADPSSFDKFTHFLLKTIEHTWGGSYAGHMKVTQPTNWSNAYFNQGRAARTDHFYDVAEGSWDEQRQFLTSAEKSLSPTSRLSSEIRNKMNEILAPITNPLHDGYDLVSDGCWSNEFNLGDAVVMFDNNTGAIVSFLHNNTNWASPSHPLVRFMYRTHSYDEKCHYAKTYKYSHGGEHPYSPGAYSPPTPGLNTSAKLVSQLLHAPISAIYTKTITTTTTTNNKINKNNNTNTNDDNNNNTTTNNNDNDNNSNYSNNNNNNNNTGGNNNDVVCATTSQTFQSIVVELDGSKIPGYSSLGSIWLNFSIPLSLHHDSVKRGATFHRTTSVFDVEVTWGKKTPTRLPESIWIETRPLLPQVYNRSIEKNNHNSTSQHQADRGDNDGGSGSLGGSGSTGSGRSSSSSLGGSGSGGNGIGSDSLGGSGSGGNGGSGGSSSSEASPWRLLINKLGTMIDTADVVENGGSALHGVAPNGTVRWQNIAEHGVVNAATSISSPSITWKSVDAQLVAPGKNTNIWDWDVYNKGTPARAQDGAAFCLFNNLYSTNYILWYPWKQEDSTSRFRFQIDFS